MIKRVIFYGDQNDHTLADQVYFNLNTKMPVSYYNKNVLLETKEKSKIELIEVDHLKSLYADHTILLFKNRFDFNSLKNIKGDITAIVNSQSFSQLNFVSKHQLKTVTYGYSNKDTITFSSREEDSFVVSLQRSIYTVTGNLVDPMEISCKFTKAKKNFPILAYVGLLIVLDEIHFKNDGYLEL